MNKAVPDALVTGYQETIPTLTLPDPTDRHVLAAAIVGRADVIVTSNLKDFPADVLQPYGIEAQHPDEFLMHQRDLNHDRFLECVKRIRARLVKSTMGNSYRMHFSSCGSSSTSHRISSGSRHELRP